MHNEQYGIESQRRRHVRIFISSTFRDMDLERSALHRRILPLLRTYFSRHGIYVDIVDYRIGIDDGQQEVDVINSCIEGVRSCYPFFFTMIGERYGWQPGQEVLHRIFGEKSLSGCLSATALEIETALQEHGSSQCVIAALRHPSYTEELAESNDENDYFEPQANIELSNLKLKIASEIPEANQFTYSNEKDFVKVANSRIKRVIASMFLSGKHPDVEFKFYRSFLSSFETAFLYDKTAFVLPRDAFDEFSDRCNTNRLLLVTGDTGCGKTTYLASYLRHVYSERNIDGNKVLAIFPALLGFDKKNGFLKKLGLNINAEPQNILTRLASYELIVVDDFDDLCAELEFAPAIKHREGLRSIFSKLLSLKTRSAFRVIASCSLEYAKAAKHEFHAMLDLSSLTDMDVEKFINNYSHGLLRDNRHPELTNIVLDRRVARNVSVLESYLSFLGRNVTTNRCGDQYRHEKEMFFSVFGLTPKQVTIESLFSLFIPREWLSGSEHNDLRSGRRDVSFAGPALIILWLLFEFKFPVPQKFAEIVLGGRLNLEMFLSGVRPYVSSYSFFISVNSRYQHEVIVEETALLKTKIAGLSSIINSRFNSLSDTVKSHNGKISKIDKKHALVYLLTLYGEIQNKYPPADWSFNTLGHQAKVYDLGAAIKKHLASCLDDYKDACGDIEWPLALLFDYTNGEFLDNGETPDDLTWVGAYINEFGITATTMIDLSWLAEFNARDDFIIQHQDVQYNDKLVPMSSCFDGLINDLMFFIKDFYLWLAAKNKIGNKVLRSRYLAGWEVLHDANSAFAELDLFEKLRLESEASNVNQCADHIKECLLMLVSQIEGAVPQQTITSFSSGSKVLSWMTEYFSKIDVWLKAASQSSLSTYRQYIDQRNNYLQNCLGGRHSHELDFYLEFCSQWLNERELATAVRATLPFSIKKTIYH